MVIHKLLVHRLVFVGMLPTPETGVSVTPLYYEPGYFQKSIPNSKCGLRLMDSKAMHMCQKCGVSSKAYS